MSTLDIIRGIAQAAANAYDGALDDKGEKLEIGLKRDEGHAILDSRVIDGFVVSFHGNMLCLKYQAECKISEVHKPGFEDDVNQRLASIVKFLKKEYKKITSDSLSLKMEDEPVINVQYISRVRTDIQAHCFYVIGNIDSEPIKGESRDSIESSFKSFVEQGGWGGKKAPNDTRKG
jgi:hypothetical protein